jgi:hypothetical protein
LERGCLREVLQGDGGLVVSGRDRFVTTAVERILSWRKDPKAFQQASGAARQRARHFVQTAATAREQLRALLTDL